MLMQTPMRSPAANSSISSNSSNPSPCGIPRPVAAKDGPLGILDLIGSQMTFGPNEEIFGEDEPAEYVYKVASGAVRTCKFLSDGRRQVGAFYLPGDIFGLEIGKKHQFSAEAIDNAVVIVVRRSAVVSLAERDCEAARALWSYTARELRRVQEHTLLLVKSAQQRVACFVLEMSKRLAATDAVDLPMARQDIADYLGLTIETVCRTMTQLVSDAAITLPTSRRVVLRNRSALRQMNS